ncbi:cadherin-16 [Spea bombifrons]|uniref:cadherin-16 n=1 Tax=Spea bombifrons TaxID=233779 RepID=UPI00234BBED8|nr:cadherin-16 [Spea bombifrons]
MKTIYLLVLLSAVPSIQATESSSFHEQVLEVPENYEGSYPWYLGKINLAADGQYNAVLAGNDGEIFGFDPESRLLYALQPFDREKRDSYTIQVILSDNKEARIEAATIQINIRDVNDNEPIMEKSTFHGIVSKGTRQGVAFVHIKATDLDDPLTENADLRYSIFSYNPAAYDNAFQIDPRTGAVSLTERGSMLLPELDVSHFELVVQVKDMGDKPTGFKAMASLVINVAENTWVTPSPVSLPENLKGNYPRVISEVVWNSTEIRYYLSGNFKAGLFTIDETGKIYIAEELDREIQSEYRIEVSPVNEDDVPYADPLHVTITVQDENDNRPVFSQKTYHVEVTRKVTKGSVLLKLNAEDADGKETINAQLHYRIVRQEPDEPKDALFRVDEKTGDVVLLEDLKKAASVKRYSLEISATDLAGAPNGLSSTCVVVIDVTDINDSPPVFLKNQFEPFIIPEDTEVGTLITSLTASDDDDLMENKLIDFYVQSGNEDGVFALSSDEDKNVLNVYLGKSVDYEKIQEYNLVVVARNRVQLYETDYGPSSTATIHVLLGNVNEAPIFTQQRYEVSVPESTQTGSLILTVEASDPDTHHPARLHYAIKNDSRKWLSIQEHSGKIKLIHALDREQYEETYNVQVIVTEEGDHGLSATADVVIHILDVNDNIPFLVGDYSTEFFCSQKADNQRILIRAYDPDSEGNSAPFTFTLVKEPNHQVKWNLTAVNGTHAYLSMSISYLEPKVHNVPIIITDSGKPPQSLHVHLPVNICQCGSSGYCNNEAEKTEGMPSVAVAMGTLLGTLGAIGFFLIIIFIHLSHAAPTKTTGTAETIPLKQTA